MLGGGLIRGECAAQEECAATVFVSRMEQAKETDSAWVAQLVERVLGKDEVTGSIPVPGSRSYVEKLSGFEAGKFEGLERG